MRPMLTLIIATTLGATSCTSGESAIDPSVVQPPALVAASATATTVPVTSLPPSTVPAPPPTQPASTLPAPTVPLPTVAPPPALTASIGVRLTRADVPLEVGAAISTLASAGGNWVASGGTAYGSGLITSTAVSFDNGPWLPSEAPWDHRVEDSGNLEGFRTSFGVVSLVQGGGTFVAYGGLTTRERDVWTGIPFVATSADGRQWDLRDLTETIGSRSIVDLTRWGSRWVIAASDETGPAVMFESRDALRWSETASLPLLDVKIMSAPTGLFALGRDAAGYALARLADPAGSWVVERLTDPTSSARLLTATQNGVLVQLVAFDGSSSRLFHTVDGTQWLPVSSPPCFRERHWITAATTTASHWVIVADNDNLSIVALSADRGRSWACIEARGPLFDTEWGSAMIAGMLDIGGTLVLYGGRKAEALNKTQFFAAVWAIYLS